MEKDFQKNVVNYLRRKGLMCYSINPPDFRRMTYGTIKQLPDLHVVDYNLYLELKDDKYKNAHLERQVKQEIVREQLVEHGAKAYKVSTLEEVKNIILKLSSNGGVHK